MGYLAVLGAIVFSPYARSKDRPIPPLPSDFSKTDVFLGTRDIGEDIYAKYGHSIVRIVDNQNNSDVGYNWGTFDFNDPDFIPKFVQGILIYHMSYSPWRQDILVSKYERRTMWMERINLTAKQKEKLIRRINWQAQPENIKFPYLFFYDNCSTRVRDFLDEALGGKIKERSFSRMTGRTYRDRVMEFNASSPVPAMGQDIVLSSEPDKEMSEWDDMFIPVKLNEYLAKMPAYDDDGREIPGLALLTERLVLTEFPAPEIPLINGYMLVWLIAGIPALFGTLLWSKTAWKKSGVRLIGAANVIVGTMWGALGLFMALSWAFGGHTVLPHNANLWLMWPIDGLYGISGILLLWRGKWPSVSGKFQRTMLWLTRGHLVGMAIFTVLGLGHLITQDVSRIVLWFVPLTGVVLCAGILPFLRALPPGPGTVVR